VRREEEPKNESRYSDVVFNPPFKIEAQRRTNEISQEIKQYSSEPKRESVSFDWNLDGFPGSKPRQEDDFKFNWDDVLEKKRQTREIDVEKIVPNQEERQDDALFAEVEETKNKNENIKDRIDTIEKEEKSESSLSIEELEKELFGEAPSQVSEDAEKELEMTLQYRREDLEGPRDKFYTYNAKRDAFQELLDKERAHIEKLEQERKAQWENLTPAEEQKQAVKEPPAFEDIFVEPELIHGNHLEEVGMAMPPETAAVMAEDEPDKDESVEDKPAVHEADEDVLAETDVVAEESGTEEAGAEEAQTEPVLAAGVLAGGVLAAEGISEAVSEEKQDSLDSQSDSLDDKQDSLETEEGEAEKPQTNIQQQDMENLKAAEQEEKAEDEEMPPFQEDAHKEKTKLRFSDVFPAEAVNADSSSDDSGSDDSGKEKQTVKKPIFAETDEEDEDNSERKGKSSLLKIIVIILAILVAVEVITIAIKIIAPDSGFSKGVDKFIGSVTSVFTGEASPEEQLTEPEVDVTYATEYINEAAKTANNIGSVSENTDLKYDISKTYSFEEISETAEFQNGIWKTDDEGRDIYIGQQIIGDVISHYNAMKDEGTLEEGVVGINKLEIGEIRTGDSGYYVLTKVTYAQEQGGESVKYESAYLTASEEDIAVKEVKEESL